MRCLYCGKELALLKRWTGGGEFCSDAHRQQYQEEYNQLALNRLLQAKPRGEDQPAEEEKAPEDIKPPETKRPEAKRPAVTRTVVEPQPVWTESRTEAPVLAAEHPEPVAIQSKEDAAPAEPAGFVVEMPVPVMADVMTMARPETDLEHHGAPSLPHRSFEAANPQLAAAGRIVLEPSRSILDYPVQRGERGLEIREFTRSARVIGFDFLMSGKTELGPVDEAMQIPISPASPAGSPGAWEQPETEFGALGIELGTWAQVAFRTTGIRDNEEDEERVALPSHAELEIAPEPREMDHVPTAESGAPTSSQSLQAEPDLQASGKPLAPAPEQRPEPVPDLVSKPMPLTLHGIAAGRGKPVQVFPSAAPVGIEVQIPRSQALPLRPLMTFGPPPKAAERKRLERTVVVKTESKKHATPPESHPGPIKVRKPEARITESAAAAAPSRPKETTSESPRQAKVKDPAPSLPALETAVDLGLPTLSLAASGSFWGRLPVIAKIGGAIGVLVVAGAVALTIRGGGNTAASSARSGVMEAGPALAIGESAWITDWGKEPGARQERQILVLRSSLNLADYRMEFQGQIESRGLGWLFRAKDPKNFYVTKLEVLRPGINPTVALVRFAVINGEEQQRIEVPLPMPVRPDTLYKIRFEAVGTRFTTWVLEHKIDEWTDDRIASGGVGLYNERGELASLKGGVSVVPLVVRK